MVDIVVQRDESTDLVNYTVRPLSGFYKERYVYATSRPHVFRNNKQNSFWEWVNLKKITTIVGRQIEIWVLFTETEGI